MVSYQEIITMIKNKDQSTIFGMKHLPLLENL